MLGDVGTMPEQLSELSPLAQALFESADRATFGTILSVSRAAGHQVQLVNRALLKLLDCSELEVVGRPLSAVFEASSLANAGAWLDQRGTGTGDAQIAMRLAGTGAEVNVSARALSLAGTQALLWIVLGDRGAARRALEQSERSFREIIESAPDAIGVGTRSGIAYANPAMCTLLGHVSSEALLGTPFTDHVHSDDVDFARARIAKVFDGENFGEPFPLPVVRGDGQPVDVEFIGMNITWDGEPAALVLGRDLGERRALQAQLIQDDRFSAVGTLAAGVAHEINNPLSYTLLNLEYLIKEIKKQRFSPPDVVRLTERIDEAQHGVARVRTIVEDLEAFSGSDEPSTMVPVDLAQVLAAAMRMAAHELKGRGVIVDRVGDAPHVLAEPARLEQVFVNLLINAAQALVRAHPEQGTITVAVLPPREGKVTVEVADNGAGIAQEHVDRVFDPFFTTKPVGVGTGLGLPICHSIVTSFGGSIDVASTLGAGTVFSVTLPVTLARARASHAPPPSREPTQRARVLVVDDEVPVAAMLERLLKPSHDVEVFTSGAAAYERLLRDPDIDVVLCDLLMPGMSGMELYRSLEKQRPGMERRLIFMTGGAFTSRASEFLRATENVHIQKPFNVDQVLSLVAEAAGRFPRR